MGIASQRLQSKSDSLSSVNLNEKLKAGNVCLHSSPAPYKTGKDSLVNEDAFLVEQVNDNTLIMAVADGVGGNFRGQDASAMIIQCLREAVSGINGERSHLREPVLNAIERCNRELLEHGTGSATTLVVVEINGTEVRPYHIGDSSIIVTGQRGVIKQRSVSHSPVGFGLEAGFIDDDEALNHKDSHLLLNLIGSSEMRIEIGAPFQLARFDTLLLCSDGLTDNLLLDDIVNTIRTGQLGHGLNSLVMQSAEKMNSGNGYPDDLTIALFRRDR